MESHRSYPLTHAALLQIEVDPDFDYSLISNARFLISQLSEDSPYSAGEISAVGLLGQIYKFLIGAYTSAVNPALFQDLDHLCTAELTPEGYNQLLLKAATIYPTQTIYQGGASPDDLLSQPDLRIPFLSSLLLIYFSNENPALLQDDEIFKSKHLTRASTYQQFIKTLEKLFISQPNFPASSSLLAFLRSPFLASPDSISGQLEYILRNWQSHLDPSLYGDILHFLDQIKEERKLTGLGPGKSLIPDFSSSDPFSADDVVRFTEDKDWMPQAILLAKNVFVWLDQLSKKYQRPINKLDEIPAAELTLLSSWGVNCLWLIGLWERSYASQRIKQLSGNPDAIPSAYSLYDYEIASALGGESSFQYFSNMARSLGIRLAADMVPNHFGIVSKWTIEHPEWFLAVATPPYPSYTYTGPDLAHNPDVEIFLEDHYYSKTDAAVVFKRVDKHTGNTRYIYHGNDGTAMPWNDTAQLDYLNPAVREAIIQTILHVASKFSLIRFDAAMTLTKKHYQRLWFPEPGSGGAIPTRSEHSLEKKDFDALMPTEFWSEVVDRISHEAPDTLLLAEAFWLMEGFFVRNLGMHRVYNSAFMHMLRDEENANYRKLIKKTLSYDPEILKRYVNFMSNPDEETALSQFGKDGKYFGVCTLLATLPGMPLFGHGQIEGYSEKYGMEYRRAYYDEAPDQTLIERHQREIFPLLKKRYLFADVSHFHLFDFLSSDGLLNEDVFAFTNRHHDEVALVIYHNAWGETQGWIHQSTPINGNTQTLFHILDLAMDANSFLCFQDHITGLEFIRSKQDIVDQGLFFELGAYDYHVFWNFHVVSDPDGYYEKLSRYLGGKGVSDITGELFKIQFDPLTTALVEILQFLVNTWLSQTVSADSSKTLPKTTAIEGNFSISLSPLLRNFLSEARAFQKVAHSGMDPPLDMLTDMLERLSSVPSALIQSQGELETPVLIALTIYTMFRIIQDSIPSDTASKIAHICSSRIYNENKKLQSSLKVTEPGHISTLVKILLDTDSEHLQSMLQNYQDIIISWFDDRQVREFLQVHLYQSVTWFNKESFETLSICFLLGSLVMSMETTNFNLPGDQKLLKMYTQSHKEILKAMTHSNFQVEPLLGYLQP